MRSLAQNHDIGSSTSSFRRHNVALPARFRWLPLAVDSHCVRRLHSQKPTRVQVPQNFAQAPTIAQLVFGNVIVRLLKFVTLEI